MSAAACWRRVRALEDSGVIAGYSVVLDREKAGFAMAAILHVKLDRHETRVVDSFVKGVRARAEVLDELSELLPDGELRVGFEDFSMSVQAHASLREKLPSQVELVGAGRVVERLRAVKEPGEVQRVRAAAELADAALRARAR